mmetsp:Transcript_1088/g.1713  ORF Transcript_1088/g.1713 Transcript_1088/m.1713 type:complete len:95 (-) Transcript_1088:376-660(-)
MNMNTFMPMTPSPATSHQYSCLPPLLPRRRFDDADQAGNRDLLTEIELQRLQFPELETAQQVMTCQFRSKRLKKSNRTILRPRVQTTKLWLVPQ